MAYKKRFATRGKKLITKKFNSIYKELFSFRHYFKSVFSIKINKSYLKVWNRGGFGSGVGQSHARVGLRSYICSVHY